MNVAEIILFLILSLINITKDITTPQSSLQELFSEPDCAESCWLGLMPGISTEDELISMLVASGIEYEERPLGIDDGSQLREYSVTGNYSHRLILDNQVFIFARYEKVSAIWIQPNDVLIFDVVTAYGLPPLITRDSQDDSISLVYPQDGIVFKLIDDNTDSIFLIFLTNEEHVTKIYIEDAVFLEVFEPCAEPTQLCAISSATTSDTDER
jgi:hypothetical protein